jgi:hypothetical protein
LLKIGHTYRSPTRRAAELSAATGVPGNYRVEQSWAPLNDAAAVERSVHTALRRYRVPGGEHFELPVADAITRIEALLPEGATAQLTWRPPLSQRQGPIYLSVQVTECSKKRYDAASRDHKCITAKREDFGFIHRQGDTRLLYVCQDGRYYVGLMLPWQDQQDFMRMESRGITRTAVFKQA